MDNGGGYAKYLHLYRKVAMISPCEPLFHHRRSVAIASIATPGVTYPRLHSTRSTLETKRPRPTGLRYRPCVSDMYSLVPPVLLFFMETAL